MTQPTVPTTGVLLGLDYGSRNIGVAISNDTQTIAMPLEVFAVRSQAKDFARLQELIQGYRAVGVIIGPPVYKSGDESPQSKLVREFGDAFSIAAKCPVTYWDERYSSAEAELRKWSADRQTRKNSRAEKSGALDGVAAQIILQSYLDAPDRSLPPGPIE